MRYAFSNASSIYVDGCLHWITRNTMPNSTDRTLVIMSFNLSDEAFGVIQTPELVVVDHHSVHELAVLDNSLCWVDSESNNHINIWIKKGDESWTRSFCLQKSIVAPPSFGPVTPIKFEQNGRLFLKNRKCVACYDVQDNTATFFDVNYGDPQRDSYPDVFPFVGSFISINSH
ncbi:hypothetical protein FRX31_001947 [Thalictrum thalictroides]|nr:hypothetical protein FRX31_001947 [Thalictrum thalictroides]